MEISWILGATIFFIAFFVLYTIIPRFTFLLLKRIFTYKKGNNFIKDYLRLFLIYFIISIPLTILLYQASTFGNRELLTKAFGEYVWATLFLFTILIISLVRLSILWKKRECLDKIAWIKKSFPRIDEEDRKKLYQEHFSFLFDIFFAGFFFGLLLWVFKATFLSDFTFLEIQQTYTSMTEVYSNIWEFIRPFLFYSLSAIVITLVIEALIRKKHHSIPI